MITIIELHLFIFRVLERLSSITRSLATKMSDCILEGHELVGTHRVFPG